MKPRWILLLLVVFIAGVFVGIWLDWKHITVARNIVYQVQNYPRANMEVYPGDKITLVPPAGGNKAGLQLNFVGYNPCVDQTPSSSCVIDTADGNAPPGPYFFTCTSSAGYSCPDPGVQQSPTIPMKGYVDALRLDLFGIASEPTQVKEGTPIKGAHPATNSVTAYVSCSTGTPPDVTVLQNLNGDSLSTITALKGETVYWISSRPFSMVTTNFPAGLCSNGNPSGSDLTEAQCDVALSGQSITYTVQAQTTPTCNPLTPAQLKIN